MRVLKGVVMIELYAMGTSGVGSTSGSQFGLSASSLRMSHCAPTMGWSFAIPLALLL